MSDELDWQRVVRALEQAASETQDDANRAAVLKKTNKAAILDANADLLRKLVVALKAGL